MENLKKGCLGDQGKVRFDEPLKRYTTYRIGGPADIFVEPATEEDVANTLAAAKEHGAPVYIIGSGSNLLVSDTGVRGLVIAGSPASSPEIVFDGARSTSGGGASCRSSPSLASERGLAGLECAGGMPGTVGAGW